MELYSKEEEAQNFQTKRYICYTQTYEKQMCTDACSSCTIEQIYGASLKLKIRAPMYTKDGNQTYIADP